jgi:acyl-CoA synthetase (NDP forming)
MARPDDRGAPDLDAIRTIVAAARREGRTTLLEPEGLAVLVAAGIAVPRWRFVRDVGALDRAEPGDAGLTGAVLDDLPGERVVVKVVSNRIAHKTEVGGIAIVPRDRAAVAAAITAMDVRLGDAAEGYTIAEHVEHDSALGGELLLSLRWTDDFGAVVSVGAGGIHAEALAADLRPGREIAIVSPSLTPRDAIGPALAVTTAVRLATTSLRGRPPRLPLEHLVEVVSRLLALGAALAPAELLECEINPACVTADGLVALDVLVTLGDGPAPARPPRPVHKLARLLEPRSVAIVGVSSTSNPGRVILGNLVREGFARDRIVVVKPGVDAIDGVRCVPDLAALPGKVDLFVVALSAAQAPAFVAEVIERDLAESLILIPAGLEEKRGGGELVARMRDALATARSSENGGPLINGGNCLGIRSRPGRYDTLFIPRWKLPAGGRPAPIALITGSGAFAVTRLSRLGRLDPRYVITVGNQMDVTVGDYLTHLGDDPAIRVFGIYVEGFARLDGARFLEAAARITAEGRTVLLYRAGRTSAGARASASHTAAIAGDAIVTRELARGAGVVVAETPGAFDELLRTFALLDGRIARGRRLGAVSNAGSECVTIADHLESLELPAFSPVTEARLAGILGPAGIDSVVDVHNPLDLTPIADAAVYEAVARTVLDADEVDVGLVGIVPVTDTLDALPAGPGHTEDLARPDAVAARMARLWRQTTKPWVAVVDAGPLYDPFAALLDAAGIPTFATADAATRALATFCDATIGRRG